MAETTSQPKSGTNGHAIPAKYSKAPLFHTNRKRDKERILNASTPKSTPSPPQTQSNPATPTTRAKPRPRPATVKAEEDGGPSPFTGPYQEFRLMSSNLNGWKYDVMRLENRKPVDVESWQQPVKLNRKELRREGPDDAVRVPEAVGPMLGPDGKPVIGSDGKIVMVDAEGRPIHRNNGESSSSKPAKEKAVGGRKKFQKKTKQVFLVPEATRLLRKEERYPWVLEDSSGSQVWTGMLEDLNKAETHAMFLPTAENIFKFVPPHRWYKFQKKPSYKVPSLEEAEKLMAQYAKQKNPEKWLSNRTKASDPSGSGIKVEESVNSHIPATVSLVRSAGQSLGPGGKKLKAVDSGMNGLFGDDDEEELDFKRKREREYGADMDGDEIDFEEDFADDEEKNPEEAEDDEAKELEERLKKEYRKAGVTKQADVVEDSADEDEEKLTGAGKAMKKMLRKSDKSGHYDNSDDEKNPYASSEEEEEEVDPAQTWTGPAIQAPPPRPGSQRPSAPPPPVPAINTNTKSQPTAASTGSRPTSPTLGGHSVVAQRATSPKAPKVGKTSRASSPLAQGSVSAQPNSRATSPATISRAGSPSSPGAPAKVNGSKRKAGEDASSAPSPPQNGAPKAKKRRGPGGAPAEELEDKAVIEWLRNTPNANTRDCIAHFKPYLTDEAKKTKFTALIKEAAQLKGGVLVLRSAYRASPQQSPEPQEG